MAKKKKTNFGETLYTNTTTYYYWLYRMLEIYMSLYTWKMPKSVDIRTLNQSLIYNGFVCFFKDENFDMDKQYIALPCTLGGEVNIYNYPTQYEITCPNGYTQHRNITDSVIIYNNDLHTVPINAINIFANRLTVAHIACDVNINNQKTPKIYRCSEQQRLSLENYLKKYQGGVPIISVTEENDFIENMVFDTSVPYVADKIFIYMQNIWNDFLTFCGVENSNNEKRERLVSAETQANYGNIEAARNTGLMTRKRGCEQVRDMFGLSEEECDVEFNSKLPTTINFPNMYGIKKVAGTKGEENGFTDNGTRNIENSNNLINSDNNVDT
ncbi:hypothetical protein [Bacteroides acidifaciens]|uniref:hypothetical protein n=1 Tax=Bacteroides acidifaciens TaxID=85831 RepID=UPI0025AE0106|nr:hypothetical protein [Bacteroides acidifaciens]